ncbi:MAG TPA: THUMP domain-containing protein [Candidatus Methylomirabilis sp.]|jgi:tRNA(Ser,Leu) C12 N-acetylase TAN1|nr:THUMP domain-containing protein [Candidatus Methylomirabilis sp.]
MDWNILLTAADGCGREAVRALRAFGRFRFTGYRNVLVGRVADPLAFLQAMQESAGRGEVPGRLITRVVPVERTFPVTAETFLQDVQAALREAVTRHPGPRFFVRLDRRGFKGRVNTQDMERALGTFVAETIRAGGGTPGVSFADPDVIFLLETVGETAGLSVIPRALRLASPLLKVR